MRKALLVGALVVVSATAVVFKVLTRSTTPSVQTEVFKLSPINPALFADSPVEPTFGGEKLLDSQLATQSQFTSPAYARWRDELKEPTHFHSKQWEYSFILQAVQERGLMAPGKKGLGFGVGREQLPAVFAKHGAEVLATDLELDKATQQGWVRGNQYMSSVDVLNERGIATPEEFQRVKGMNVDMTNIPADLQNFDFTWSTCALGHLGNRAKGVKFIEDSLKTLKPGGVAVHTTEFNLSSDTETFETPNTSVYTKRDIQQLVARLTAQGHQVRVNFNIGGGPLDKVVDETPFTKGDHVHLRLRLGRYAVTSLGLIITKAATTAP
jgi:hypothetical protein